MISAVVLTKNEEKNIRACIETLLWCDEVIVIDDESEDQTVAIAKELGATVYAHSLDGNFADQRNFGVQKAKSDWVLFVDADERISDSLSFEISQATSHVLEATTGYLIRRIDYIWGKELRHGDVGNVKLLRLGRKDRGQWKGRVHEKWHVKGEVAILKNPLFHYPHQTISEFLEEINRYSTVRADELYTKKKKVFWHDIILYPKAKFFYLYFLKVGVLDGTSGLVHALMMSFHAFLVRGKLWLLYKKGSKHIA